MQSLYSAAFFTLVFLFLFVSCLSCSKEEPGSDDLNDDPVEKKENIWVFLMAGQSNMAGRGTIEAQDLITNDRILTINQYNSWIIAKEPLHFYESGGLDCGMSFAREMLKHVPDSITIAMIPCAVGGSSVFKWLNDEEHRGVKLLSNFEQKVELSKSKGVIKGILWHQGESNAKTNDIPNYKNALLELFNKFRTSIENNDLPIILGEIGRFAEPEEKAGYFEQINQIIRAVAAENNNLYHVSSEGLEHKGDHLHFNSEAQRELGRRYAAVMEEIIIINNNK